MVRLVIRQVNFEQLEISIDRFDKSALFRQQMHHPDAADAQAARALHHVIINVARREHRPIPRQPWPRRQAPLDTSFAFRCFSLSTVVTHSKCLLDKRMLIRSTALLYSISSDF